MTRKLSSEEPQDELTWEQDISRYLQEHPDFLDRHPALFASLNVAHATDGRVVSLIERQVGILRTENDSLQRQLRELVTIARENDVLAARLHRFALAMADSSSLDDVFDTAYEMLRREFKLDAITILAHGTAPGGFTRAEFVGDDGRLPELLKQVDGARPLCGGKLEDSLMSYLYGRQATDIRSSAIIPLGNPNPLGVLCLGSIDPQRFHSAMGTVYLLKLGDILLHSIARFT